MKGPKITRPYEPTTNVQSVTLSPNKINSRQKSSGLWIEEASLPQSKDCSVYERAVDRALTEVNKAADNLHALKQLPHEMITANPQHSFKKKKIDSQRPGPYRQRDC